MSPTRKRAQAPVLVVLLLAAGLLSGCGVSSDDKPSNAASDSASPDATESATPTESDSPSPSPSETVQSPTAAPSPTLAPGAALLTAQQMPPLNDSSPWRLVRTGPVSSNPFGLCAKFDVLSIGAEQAVERRFTSAGGGTAGQEIATFPDAATAARAQHVFQSWHETCSKRVPGHPVRVRPISSVPVSQGAGWWYLVSYSTHPGLGGGEGRFHTFGLVAVGTRMSLLTMDHPGQDHNYPPGQDPMQLAVKAAAGKLG